MATPKKTADALRRELVDRIPASYRPWLHLVGTTSVGAATLALSVAKIAALGPAEVLVVPATLLAANAFEWRVHKHVLHRRVWPLGEIFDRHTPEHHAVFRTNDMAMRGFREMKLVLIPAVGILGIVVATGPAAMAVGTLLTPNAGWLFLATGASYLVAYELLHLAYHLPADHPIARNRWIAKLRRHHAVHHDPRNMQKWNFNVTVPFWDWVKGTITDEERSEEAEVEPVAAS
jgi:hypothetical protein